LYELAWRHRIAFWPIDANVTQLLTTIADPSEDCGLGVGKQLEIAAMLLRAARVSGKDEEFERWASILNRHAEPSTDVRAELAYQRALRARDRLDFRNMLSEQDALRRAPDPIWRLRLASLLYDLDEFSNAHDLVGQAMRELQERQLEDRVSLWLRS